MYFWDQHCNLRGSANELVGTGRTATRICINGTADKSALQVLGETGASVQTAGIRNIDFFRDKAATGGVGLALFHTAGFYVEHCKFNDFSQAINLDHATNTIVDKSLLSNTQGSADFIAIYIGGSDTRGSVSSVFTSVRVEARGNTNPAKRAVLIGGANPHDLKFFDLEVQGCNCAVLVDFSGAIAPNRWGDVQFIGCAIDGWNQYAYRFTGGDARSAAAVIGGWTNPTPTGADCVAYDIDQFYNLLVSDYQSQDVADTGLMVTAQVTSSVGIKLRNGVATDAKTVARFTNSTDCEISGTTIDSGGSHTRAVDVDILGDCVRVKSNGNTHRGASTIGTRVASGAVSCEVVGNSFAGTIATPFSNSSGSTIEERNIGA